MLLVDALYINKSGGLELLKYLVETIRNEGVSALFLIDKRCAESFNYLKSHEIEILSASLCNRLLYYIKNVNKFEKILCFGNIPPPIHIKKAQVYTYFHNIYLLDIPSQSSFITKLLIKAKQKIIFNCRYHTDYWLVQTTNMRDAIHHGFEEPLNKVLLYPFWRAFEDQYNSPKRQNYVYVANYIPEKQHLLLIKVWRKLHELGFDKTLHLTLSSYPHDINRELTTALQHGVKIVNHGYVAPDKIIELYKNSAATIYTSLNESFGLGIIEALEQGCDVIGPNLPYIHSICKPSVTFETFEIADIVNAIMLYEQGKELKSQLTISNQINNLVKMLK